ncbi:stalk domain-containing protein [Paenibacillus sp. Marseille-Q4541]|uniref:stalk domain-containing protein n=1 Tax=Paenibacillus sp. Marseille-Q4541 TaxID=2831522 RepID=UPI001BA6F7A5|nr:stalk domain-containing protein [Paenibacillus sp. Marseille-Q4541]
MKNFKKSMITLSVVGMTLTGAAGVYAGTNLQKITAYLNHNLGIQVNGAAYQLVDNNGKKLTPITYQNTTYLPIRTIADAVQVPVSYDAKNKQVLIGTKSTNPGQNAQLTNVKYSDAQIKEMEKAFANFEHFETAYAPTQMVKGDSYQKSGASDDGVRLVFKHMAISISPRDYSDGYDSKTVTLSNGTKAKWYTPDETAMLGFKLDDRIVTLSSPDHTLSKAQLEKVAVSVAKLN